MECSFQTLKTRESRDERINNEKWKKDQGFLEYLKVNQIDVDSNEKKALEKYYFRFTLGSKRIREETENIEFQR